MNSQEEEILLLTQKVCELEEKLKKYTNGIDRMDSKKGYVLNNTNACCGECNYMKFTFDFNEFINKLVSIYEKHKHRMNNEENKEFELVNNSIPRNKPKKSIEEIKEEYKKIRAKKIASYRA